MPQEPRLLHGSNYAVARRSGARPARPNALLSIAAIIATAIGATVVGASQVAAAPAEQLKGLWYDDTGRGAVEISDCGDKLCGRIVWLESTVGDDGRELTDRLNPRPSQRSQPICGLKVIGGVTRQRDGSWDNGWIYDPKVGKDYDVALAPVDADTLAVTGYVGVKFLSRTLLWRRAPETLERCAQ